MTTNSTKSDQKTLLSKIQARQGLARSNRFFVDFSAITNIVSFASPVQAEDLNYFCESTSIPGRNIETVEYGIWHRPIKLPAGYTNDDVTMTFHMTNDYFIKILLDTWMGLIIDVDSYLLNYTKSYAINIKIYQLDQYDRIVYGVELVDAYPYTVKAIELNNGTENEIVSCSASFAYKDFKILNQGKENPLLNYYNSTTAAPFSQSTILPGGSNPFFPTVPPSIPGVASPSKQIPNIPNVPDAVFQAEFESPSVIIPPTSPDYDKPIVSQQLL